MRVEWSPYAMAQLRATLEMIADDNPAAAVRLARDVLQRARRLSAFPYLGRVGRVPDTRELVVHRNYLITYQVFADRITVLQIWHVARERIP